MNVCAAIKIAEAAPDGSVVATILCDNGVKCVSYPHFIHSAKCMNLSRNRADTDELVGCMPCLNLWCSKYGRYLSKVYNNEWLGSNSLSPVEDVSVLSKL